MSPVATLTLSFSLPLSEPNYETVTLTENFGLLWFGLKIYTVQFGLDFFDENWTEPTDAHPYSHARGGFEDTCVCVCVCVL